MSSYPNNSVTSSSWLNENFFHKVLSQSENLKNIKIKHCNLFLGSGKGDNYLSVLYRATINYSVNNENKIKSLIIKTIPEQDGQQADTIKESKSFETEIGMYTKIIPKFEEMLKAAGDNTKLSVECIYYELKPRQIIIFEDIVPLGYNLIRERTPNVEEIKAAYTKLAKWHAVSYKIYQEDPNFFDDYNNGLFMQESFQEAETFKYGIKNFIQLLDEHEDLQKYKKYFIPYIEKIMNDVVKIFKEARENPQINGLYGLCHGDFHHKNLMFKYDEKSQKLLDVMPLDFQMCYLGPMVNDILYSTYTMLFNADLRKNNLNEIRYHYFQIFQETLQKIDYKGKIPKIIEFQMELMDKKIWDLYLFITFLPFWYVFHEASMNPDDALFDAKKSKAAWNDPRYIKEVKELLPKFLHMGYLEK